MRTDAPKNNRKTIYEKDAQKNSQKKNYKRTTDAPEKPRKKIYENRCSDKKNSGNGTNIQ